MLGPFVFSVDGIPCLLLPAFKSLMLLPHENLLIFSRREFDSLLEKDDNLSASGHGYLLDVPSSFIYLKDFLPSTSIYWLSYLRKNMFG